MQFNVVVLFFCLLVFNEGGWGGQMSQMRPHERRACVLSPLLTARRLSLSLSLSLPSLPPSCSSSLLGSWSARSCRAVPVHSFRTKCVCDSISTFAILARVNFDSVSPPHRVLLLLVCVSVSWVWISCLVSAIRPRCLLERASEWGRRRTTACVLRWGQLVVARAAAAVFVSARRCNQSDIFFIIFF